MDKFGNEYTEEAQARPLARDAADRTGHAPNLAHWGHVEDGTKTGATGFLYSDGQSVLVSYSSSGGYHVVGRWQ